MSSSFSRAKFTAATTSAVPLQRTTNAGRRSIIALKTLRASSYAWSLGVTTSPRTLSRRPSIVWVLIAPPIDVGAAPFLLLRAGVVHARPLGLRFRPVVPDADVDGEHRVERIRADHLLAHELADLRDLGL